MYLPAYKIDTEGDEGDSETRSSMPEQGDMMDSGRISEERGGGSGSLASQITNRRRRLGISMAE